MMITKVNRNFDLYWKRHVKNPLPNPLPIPYNSARIIITNRTFGWPPNLFDITRWRVRWFLKLDKFKIMELWTSVIRKRKRVIFFGVPSTGWSIILKRKYVVYRITWINKCGTCIWKLRCLTLNTWLKCIVKMERSGSEEIVLKIHSSTMSSVDETLNSSHIKSFSLLAYCTSI